MPDPNQPITPIPTLQQQPGYSPEAVKMLREYAKQLLGDKQKPTSLGFYSPWQGLADASSKIMAGMAGREADVKEQQRYENLARGISGNIPTGDDDDSSAAPPQDNSIRGTIKRAWDAAVNGGSEPASIRANNPGAAWNSPLASQYGATGSINLPGGNNAAKFDNPEDGAAYQFALLNKSYTGMPLSDAIEKWSGGNNTKDYLRHIEKQTGLGPDTLVTSNLLSSPDGVKLAKSMSHWEAGKPFPLDDDAWGRSQIRGLRGQTPAAVPPSAAVAAPGVGGGTSPTANPGSVPRIPYTNPADLQSYTAAQPNNNGLFQDLSRLQRPPLPRPRPPGAPQPLPNDQPGNFDQRFGSWGAMPSGPGAPVMGPTTPDQNQLGGPGTPRPRLPSGFPVPGALPLAPEGAQGNAPIRLAQAQTTPTAPASPTGAGQGAFLQGALLPNATPPNAPQAPTASPQATPAQTPQGQLPGFIPPTQQFPGRAIQQQVQALIRSGDPALVAQGTALANAWQTKYNEVQQVERGGYYYQGNPYKGYRNTGLPAKPELRDVRIGDTTIPFKPAYGPNGEYLGERPAIAPGGGGNQPAPPQRATPQGPAPAPGTVPWPANVKPAQAEPEKGPGGFNKEEMQKHIDNTPSQRPKFPEDPNFDSLIQFGGANKEYERSGEKFQTIADRNAASAQIAKDRLDEVNVLDKVLEKVKSGKGTATLADLNAVAANIFHTNDEMSTWRQVANKLASKQTVGDIRDTNVGQGVAVRQTESDAIKASQFDLGNQTGANRAIVRLQKRALEREIEFGTFSNLYAEKHGRLDNGVYKAWNDWTDKHPFISKGDLNNSLDIIKEGSVKPGQVVPDKTTPSSSATSGYQLGQTATNKNGDKMIYTEQGWKKQ